MRQPRAVKNPAAEAAAQGLGSEPAASRGMRWPVSAEGWVWGHVPLGALGPRSGQISGKAQSRLGDPTTRYPLGSLREVVHTGWSPVTPPEDQGRSADIRHLAPGGKSGF